MKRKPISTHKRNRTPFTQRKPHMTEILKTKVAGLKFGSIQEAQPSISAGRACRLVWERSNQYDRQAIRVDSVDSEGRFTKLGYIPKELTAGLHAYRHQGIKLVVKVSGYFPTNPSWDQLYLSVCAPDAMDMDQGNEVMTETEEDL